VLRYSGRSIRWRTASRPGFVDPSGQKVEQSSLVRSLHACKMTRASVGTTGASLFGALYSLACYRRAACQLRRRISQRHRARSKDRSWAYLRYEFHVGASRGSVCVSPRLTENREIVWLQLLRVKALQAGPNSRSALVGWRVWPRHGANFR
jgi:hypothetical protein